MKQAYGLLLLAALMPFAACCANDGTEAHAGANSAVAEGNTAFALELYQRVAREPGNLFISPFSLSSALAMTYAGAAGETAEQMAGVLHFPEDIETLHSGFGKLTRSFSRGSKGQELAVANALWGQEGYRFLESFLAPLESNYAAGLRRVDFRADPERARITINDWVEKQTRERIKDLLKPGVVDSATRLVLTNAIYFKAFWAVQFDKARTREADFHVTPGKSVSVPMMGLVGGFLHTEQEDCEVLELLYKGGLSSMVLFLPKAVDGLPALERSLSPKKLADALAGLRERPLVVQLPRFTATSEFRLEDVLAAMGMPLAFTGAADFSGMTGNRELYISAVVHKAFVDVNEEGTEAAAASGVVMRKGATPAFRADHPFFFLIRDRETNSILFMGRVQDPSG